MPDLPIMASHYLNTVPRTVYVSCSISWCTPQNQQSILQPTPKVSVELWRRMSTELALNPEQVMG